MTATDRAAELHEHVAAWPRQTLEARIHHCAFMLGLHGFISDRERFRIARRVQRRFQKEAAASLREFEKKQRKAPK